MSDFSNDGSFWNLLNSDNMNSGSTLNSQFRGFSSQAPMTPEQLAFSQSQQQTFFEFQQNQQQNRQQFSIPQQQSQSLNPLPQTDELFGPDAKPRSPGKQCSGKKRKTDTLVGTGWSSLSSQYGDIMTKELRLEREAAEAAFEVAKEKERTVMRLEEMKFLTISTKDLSGDDAYFIEEQKKTIRAKYNLYRN
nr:hypothetical protein [Tanacetum cinerariifolium]